MKRLIYVMLFLLLIQVGYSENSAQLGSYFLSLSDIHFNPYASCSENKPCLLISKLRDAPISDWQMLLKEADKGRPTYGQDTNYSLLMASMQNLTRLAQEKKIETVFVLGDFLSHDYRKNYKKFSQDNSQSGYERFVKKTLGFLAIELAAAFPKSNVYCVVGNNDSYLWDYKSDPNGLFFKETAQTFSRLMKDKNNQFSMQRQFANSGYYSVDLKNLNQVKLIALNTVLFSTYGRGKMIASAANRELLWLHEQLKQAKLNHQKVMIMMHIPMSVDVYLTSRLHLFSAMTFWKPHYVARFKDELNEFAPEIMLILSSHLHRDGLQFFQAKEVEIPMSSTTSISPIFGNDPGLKLYFYSKEKNRVQNFMTYYWSLNQSSVLKTSASV